MKCTFFYCAKMILSCFGKKKFRDWNIICAKSKFLHNEIFIYHFSFNQNDLFRFGTNIISILKVLLYQNKIISFWHNKKVYISFFIVSNSFWYNYNKGFRIPLYHNEIMLFLQDKRVNYVIFNVPKQYIFISA